MHACRSTLEDPPDNAGFEHLVAWSWARNDVRYLIVVNLSDGEVQGRIHSDWEGDAATWALWDKFSGVTYDRGTEELRSTGLYVDLQPWAFHFFECRERK